MRIVKLQVDNVLRLKAAEVTPDPDDPLVLVGGRNGAGKSSLMNCIDMALKGKDACPPKPIHNGAEKGYILLETEEITVERWFKKDGSSRVEVRSKEGAKFPSPQAMLDRLTGKKAVDPLQFARMGEDADGRRRQVQLVKEIFGLDFSDEEAAAKKAYDERTILNRELKAEQSRLAAMPVQDAPDEEVDVAALMEEYKRREAINKAMDAQDVQLERLQTQRRNCDDRLSDLATEEDGIAGKLRVETQDAEAFMERQIADLRKRFAETKAKLEAAALAHRERITSERASIQSALKDVQDKIVALKSSAASFQIQDLAEIGTQIQHAGQINEKVRAKKARAEVLARVESLSKQVTRQSAILEEMAASKARKLAEAKFPIEGLGFDDYGVTLHGLPLEQASDAEKLRLSVAIALAQSPELRVLCIRDGSLLDERSLRLLATLASETDAQLWIEIVGDRKECVVVIEDGQVKREARN